MRFNFLRILAAALIAPALASAQEDATALARRVATIASIAVDEYSLGVRDGRIVSSEELDEARLFLAEAASLAERLPAEVRGGVHGAIVDLAESARDLAPPDRLHRQAEALRALLANQLGINLDPLPAATPSLAEGSRVYVAHCSSCHGELGAGTGPAAAGLDPPPADLTDVAALRGSNPLEFFRKVTVGIAGTGMPGFEDRLSVEQRWAVALYASGLRHGDVARAEGERWLRRHCPECLLRVSGLDETAAASDDSLATLIAAAAPTAPASVVAFARTAAAREVLGGDSRVAAQRVAQRVDDAVAEATTLALAGLTDAALSTALDAYLVFEQIEGAVGARSMGTMRAVEGAFADFRTAIASGDAARVQQARGVVRDALDGATDVLVAASSPVALFAQSILIILREGIEAILIVGALVAFLARAGAAARTREIGYGVGAALVASLVTAAAFAGFVSISLAGQEALEGITMLLASVVLFSVASWMVSKIEADKWRRFVEARLARAVGNGGGLALSGVAFLAVYREGFETVLFYGALYGSAETPAAATGVTTGLGLGLAILAAVYLTIRRYGVRIPVKPFFAVTGILLTVLAVSFAGQGVAELQAAGWVPATPLGLLPAFPALGVFPTLQTTLAQAFVGIAFLLALGWIFVLSPRLAVSVPRRQLP